MNFCVAGSNSRSTTSTAATPILKFTSLPQVEAPPAVITRSASSIEVPGRIR